jgi:uncharacterized SAM-binding protein YcdF (DUF218 family)
MNLPRSRWRVPVRLLFAAAVLATGTLVGCCLGAWLVAADPPARSDAIFVLDGLTPLRELEAAALFREGWAPRIVLALPRSPIPEEVRRLAGDPTPQERAARVLRRGDVPAGEIVHLDRPVENTLEELQVDFEYARARGFRRVIIVTSPYHTRRVRIIWNARFEREVPALVRPTRYEPVDPSRWWRSGHALEEVLHEAVGIVHFFIGTPIPTFDRGR